MHRFRAVHSAVHAAVAGICWWVLQHMEQLQTYIADYRSYAVMAVLAGLALLFRTSDSLAKTVVEKIPFVSPLLRRVLSGREFVEGDWPLVVVDMEAREPLYFGFLTIGFKDGQPYVHGDDWTVDGAHAHAFHSMQSLYHDYTMQYWYEQGASLHRPDMRGFTEIFFFPKFALAERHAGRFLDPRHTADIRFYAGRRRYGLFERRLETKEQKLEAARQVWAKLEPQLDAVRSRDISADFA